MNNINNYINAFNVTSPLREAIALMWSNLVLYPTWRKYAGGIFSKNHGTVLFIVEVESSFNSWILRAMRARVQLN